MEAVTQQPDSTQISVLYEDDLLLVCVKPSGILSAADASGKPSLPSLLSPRRVFPVHRLDYEVCGVMVFAKTAQAAAVLSAQIGSCFVKEYLAVCETPPSFPEGELRDLLYHDRTRNKTYIVQRQRNGVREASLTFRVLHDCLLFVRLQTGRTHQIRVQLASRGCPLRGDRKYGAKTTGQLALWAWRLSFRHPDGRQLAFTLPSAFLPPDLEAPFV